MAVLQWRPDALDAAPDATDSGVDRAIADDITTTCTATRLDWGQSGQWMFPGADCIGCHRPSGSAATVPFTAAGTVFSAVDCPAGLSGAQIEIEDVNHQTITLMANSAGNFFTNMALVPPLRTRVSFAGTTMSMTAPVSNGSCNSCHAHGDAGTVGYLTH